MTILELINELKKMPQHLHVVDDTGFFIDSVQMTSINVNEYASFNRNWFDTATVADIIEQLKELPQQAIILSPCYDEIGEVYIDDDFMNGIFDKVVVLE